MVQYVDLERQVRHVHYGGCDVLDIEDILNFVAAIGLRDALSHSVAHVSCGIA